MSAPAMKLNVIAAVAAAYAFSLRHFPAFYLLVVLAGVPQYIYSQLPCPEPEAKFVSAGVEMLISCVVVALMAATLKRDRRGESWTVLSGFADTLTRSVTVLGVAAVSAIYISGLLFLVHTLDSLHPWVPLAAQVVHFIVLVLFCMAVPCAAIETRGVLDCIQRSVTLSVGSRMRIAAAGFLALVPLTVAWIALVVFGADLSIEGLWEIVSFFGLAAFSVFPFALPAIIHASLAGPEDDNSFAIPEAVFD